MANGEITKRTVDTAKSWRMKGPEMWILEKFKGSQTPPQGG